MYRKGEKYKTKPGRTYFFINQPGFPEKKFTEAINTYCNALINSDGGIIVFGVDDSGYVNGFELSRKYEDMYKLRFDAAIRQMRPTIHPHQYRLNVMYIEKQRRAIFEIRMSAGELEHIYENSKQEMYIVKDKKLYGPLHPCEIHQIVLAKFKEEISTLIIKNNQPQQMKLQNQEEIIALENSTVKNTIPSQIEEKKAQINISSDDLEIVKVVKKSKLNKITWP
ncbi:schlafen-like protein 1 [Xenia sp. Carnegie-2017]|uniref:schlafen-like protein 1 n=1 Tax=Xenia sp. Carnegie-2017 TaxID=2897299 RepID=UPI001F03CE2F|nr:schlafen-like protein 1 [Xenia sp. Carnegie-2017]